MTTQRTVGEWVVTADGRRVWRVTVLPRKEST